jgi:hypothetical protein
LKARNRVINHFRHFNGTISCPAFAIATAMPLSASWKNETLRLQFSARLEGRYNASSIFGRLGGHGQIAPLRHRGGDPLSAKERSHASSIFWALGGH